MALPRDASSEYSTGEQVTFHQCAAGDEVSTLAELTGLKYVHVKGSPELAAEPSDETVTIPSGTLGHIIQVQSMEHSTRPTLLFNAPGYGSVRPGDSHPFMKITRHKD